MFSGIAVAGMQKPKPYGCTVCEVHFNKRFNRDRHMEVIHKVPRPAGPPLYPEMLKNIVPVQLIPAKKPKKVAEPEELGPAKKPRKVEEFPMITLHYCGDCAYPGKHRYFRMGDGNAMAMVPMCGSCNDLNLQMAETYGGSWKKSKDTCWKISCIECTYVSLYICLFELYKSLFESTFPTH